MFWHRGRGTLARLFVRRYFKNRFQGLAVNFMSGSGKLAIWPNRKMMDNMQGLIHSDN